MVTIEKRECVGCGESFAFQVSPSRANRGRFCSRSCSAKTNSKRHGYCSHTAQSPTYRSYMAMKARCLNKNSAKFYMYGAVGITICQRWIDGFEFFLQDMGERPAGKTLDRINGDLGYCKENCRWATPYEQQSNIKFNVFIEHNGKTATIAEWSRITGIRQGTLAYRVRRGWNNEEVLGVAPFTGNRRIYS